MFWAAGIVWLAYGIAQTGGERPHSGAVAAANQNSSSSDGGGASDDDSEARDAAKAISAFEGIKG